MAIIKGKHTLKGNGGDNCWHVLGSKGYDGLKVSGSYSYMGETEIKNISVEASKTSGATYGYDASLWLIQSTDSLSTVGNSNDSDNKYIKSPSEKIHLYDFANGTGTYTANSKSNLTPGRWYFAMSCGQGGTRDLDGCTVGYEYFVIVSGAIEIATKNSAPTILLTDNGDNSYTLRGIAGKAGENNEVVSTTLYKSTSDSKYAICSSNPYTEYLTRSATIYGKVIDKPGHGSSQEAKTSKTILYYKAPTAITTATINPPTGKTRWTEKDAFTVTWDGAKAANTNSQIKGYRIFLYVNGTRVELKDKSGNSLVTGKTPDNAPYYEVGENTKSITIYPEAQSLNIGDKVRVGLYVWAENKKGKREWSGGGNKYVLYSGASQGSTSDKKLTNEITIQPAATMWVKINETTWKESESVWVKTANGWKEAESVWAKTSAGWKESQ